MLHHQERVGNIPGAPFDEGTVGPSVVPLAGVDPSHPNLLRRSHSCPNPAKINPTQRQLSPGGLRRQRASQRSPGRPATDHSTAVTACGAGAAPTAASCAFGTGQWEVSILTALEPLKCTGRRGPYRNLIGTRGAPLICTLRTEVRKRLATGGRG